MPAFSSLSPRTLVLASVLLSVVASGCSSTMVRPGTWTLTIEGQDLLLKEPIDFPERRVRVEVESNGNENFVEQIGISSLEEGDDLMELFGDVAEDGRVLIRGTEGDMWNFNFQGKLEENGESIDGERFLARHRFEEDTTFVGTWNMQWIGELPPDS